MSSDFRLGSWVVQPSLNTVSRDGKSIRLEPKVLEVLVCLAEDPGHTVPKERLIRAVWGDTFVTDDVLTRCISELRKALEDDIKEPQFIETIPRRGYRLVAQVKPLKRYQLIKPSKRMGWPVAVRLWAAAGAGLLLVAILAWKIRTRKVLVDSSAASIHSLAVLPLESLSADSSQAYFADGMTDQLITTLGQINELRVISRSSTMQYKGTNKPLQQIARELRVDAIVEGTVLRSGDQVRITTQLIDPYGERHLWSQSYQRNLRDILGLQSEVASAVAIQIRKKLIHDEPPGARRARSINPEAYELFLRGLSLPITTDGNLLRLQYFEKAVRLQPDYAEAHADIGHAYIRLGHALVLPPQEAFSKAKAAATKVLDVDPLFYQGHLIEGNVKFLHEWDFAGAEKEMRLALELGPNVVYSRHSYADFLVAMGRAEEAIAQLRKQIEIDPFDVSAQVQMASLAYMCRNYAQAIAQARKVLAQDPNNWAAHLWLGLALEQKHDFAAAIDELKKATEHSNIKMWVGFVAHAKALSGDKAGAQRILKHLHSLAVRTYVSPWWFAVIYTGLGDRSQAFTYLERSYRGREHDLAFSNVWPIFDELHSDPRYEDLVRRIGLPVPRRMATGAGGQ